MDVWVQQARIVKDAMVCSVVFGTDTVPLLTVKDVWVRSKNDGSGLWFKFPDKVRMDRTTGEPVKDENGYTVRDEQVTIFIDDTTSKPTKAAFQLKDQILAAITETYGELKPAARPAATAARPSAGAKPAIKTATAPAAVRGAKPSQRPAGIGAARAPQVVEDEFEDEEVPF